MEQFIESVGNKNFDNILRLTKFNNRLIELKTKDGLPYIFIITEFINPFQFTQLIKDLPISIISIKDSSHRNILQFAIDRNINDVTYHLIHNITKYSIDVNHENINGRTALHYATSNNNIKAVELLLNQPTINVNHQNNGGDTPMHYATWNNHLQAVELLLRHQNIEINLQNNVGDTPLHCAVYYNHKYIVRLILETINITINIFNQKGQTPYDIAVLNDYREITNLFIRKTDNKHLPPIIKPKPVINKTLSNQKYNSIILNPNKIENDIKIREKEIKELKTKLEIQKLEAELKAISLSQRQLQLEIGNTGYELESLNEIDKEAKNNKHLKAEIAGQIIAKEMHYDQLLKKIINATEKEMKIKHCKESLNTNTERPEQKNTDDECPICFDCMYNKRIYQCSKGHHYCEVCKDKIKTCPYCREDISKSEIRSRILERILARSSVNQ